MMFIIIVVFVFEFFDDYWGEILNECLLIQTLTDLFNPFVKWLKIRMLWKFTTRTFFIVISVKASLLRLLTHTFELWSSCCRFVSGNVQVIVFLKFGWKSIKIWSFNCWICVESLFMNFFIKSGMNDEIVFDIWTSWNRNFSQRQVIIFFFLKRVKIDLLFKILVFDCFIKWVFFN